MQYTASTLMAFVLGALSCLIWHEVHEASWKAPNPAAIRAVLNDCDEFVFAENRLRRATQIRNITPPLDSTDARSVSVEWRWIPDENANAPSTANVLLPIRSREKRG